MSQRRHHPAPPLTPAQRRLVEVLARIAYRRLRERKLPRRQAAK